MDPYDESQRQQHHPSHSIPNAAYPDSPYRPGEGQSRQPTIAASSSHGLSSTTSSPSLAFTPHTTHQPGQWPGDAAISPANLAIPQGPPPPYDPTRTPTSYSPLDASPSASHRPTTSPHDDGIPLQDMTPAASVSDYQLQQQRQHHHIVAPTPQTSAASTMSDKLGPAAARLRKRRRMKICIVVAGAVAIFITALMIGIGMGVIKQALHDDDNEIDDD